MKIYFDMNVYNRVFDDQSQMRIRFEAMAIDILFELVEKGQHGQDYLKEQGELYRDMSLDEIFEEAQKHWESSEVRSAR
ncbi:hypothetical protein [Desulfosporosinus sp. BICA1-9]|uniref:hypothetical protein n=1 Tax=Desulfosporosinus sp. BICA1-9 TaxID=1531958 RepID=UPI0025BF9143|nr:hypothetical protein [Desulfosporosinus sp. BICA1-9]